MQLPQILVFIYLVECCQLNTKYGSDRNIVSAEWFVTISCVCKQLFDLGGISRLPNVSVSWGCCLGQMMQFRSFEVTTTESCACGVRGLRNPVDTERNTLLGNNQSVTNR